MLMPAWLGTTFQSGVKMGVRKGAIAVQGGAVGWLQGIIGKHAKGIQSMCQQRAGIQSLARVENVKGLGRRGLIPKPVLRQSSLKSSSTWNIHQVLKIKGTNSQSFTVSHFRTRTYVHLSSHLSCSLYCWVKPPWKVEENTTTSFFPPQEQ